MLSGEEARTVSRGTGTISRGGRNSQQGRQEQSAEETGTVSRGGGKNSQQGRQEQSAGEAGAVSRGDRNSQQGRQEQSAGETGTGTLKHEDRRQEQWL